MNKKRFFTYAVMLLVTILVWPARGLAAEDIKRVALFPFEINSTATDSAATLRETVYQGVAAELLKTKNLRLVEKATIIAATAGKRIDNALALAVGRKIGAAYAVMGSFTEFGEQISVDVRLIDIQTGKVLPGVYVQGKGRQRLGAILAQLQMDIRSRIAPEQRIARIEFRGNRKIESSVIKQALRSAVGDILTEAELSADIKAIFKLGHFDDVTAEVTDIAEGKVIAFIVMEKPMITEIRINGNKVLKRDEIEAVISVRNRQIVNPEKLKADTEKIKTLYDGKGFYNAEIRYAIEKDGERDVRVVISIIENEKLFIRNIAFEGNRTFTTKELKNMMTTNEWGIFHIFTDSGLLKKDQLKQDVGKIKAFYLNNGFINAQVGEPEISYDREGITIKIPVSEGKPFRVGKVAISGDELKIPRADLLAKLLIKKKDFYDREAIMKDMDYLTQACNDEGFANADIAPRTEPQEKTQTVDVTYEITKRKPVYFNRINITGNTKTRDKVIRRELSVVEGDLYSRTKLKRSYMALNRLRFFEEIDFQAEKGPDETLTDVNIQVKEKPTGMFSIGAGYSAIDHAVVSAQVSQQNLFGRGQILSLKASIGANSQLYDLSFIEPWLFDMPLWSKLELWNLYRQYDSYKLDTKGFGATLGYPLWQYVTGYVGYRLSIDDVNDVLDTASYYIKKQAGETTSSGVTLSVTRDSTDDVIFPSTGSKNSASVEHTGGILLGDVSYTRYGMTSAWFFPLPLDTVLGVRGRIGYMQPNEGKEVPIFERYYLGGINSLRGLREVGPRDPVTGDVIGGLTMLNFNVEYVFPLIKNAGMKGLVFFDTGNSWESGYHLGDMRKTAGVGVRWYSPIGPLRLEWGYVLDRKESESASRWEFTIGMFM
ncbi:MAG: outer membrane protein assembly factor BamA [Syntrophales bacterium]|nr:outer membrane protein assembly factor BamA [Syntrophales bacterium]